MLQYIRGHYPPGPYSYTKLHYTTELNCDGELPTFFAVGFVSELAKLIVIPRSTALLDKLRVLIEGDKFEASLKISVT